MHFLVPDRALLQGLMASGLILAGATACSRADRDESGSSNNAAIAQDTAMSGTGQSSGTSSMTAQDTSMADGQDTSTRTATGTAPGDTAPAEIRSNAPRAATTTKTAQLQDTATQGDTAAGYRAMERDTGGVQMESDSARVTQDTGATSSNQTDTIFAAIATADTMAVADTSTAAVADDQIDTTATAAEGNGSIQASVDTAHADAEVTASADTSTDVVISADVSDTIGNTGRVRPPEDSTEILGEVTTNENGHVATADTVSIGEAAVGARGEDTANNAGRIRPPEDSTELLGSPDPAVTTDEETVIGGETADEEPVNPAEQEIKAEDRESVAAAEDRTDNVGAAAMTGMVTGAEAVALMERQGVRCGVVNPESEQEVRWDMSSTPVTLNPCGLGSMNLSKVWTAGTGRQE